MCHVECISRDQLMRVVKVGHTLLPTGKPFRAAWIEQLPADDEDYSIYNILESGRLAAEPDVRLDVDERARRDTTIFARQTGRLRPITAPSSSSRSRRLWEEEPGFDCTYGSEVQPAPSSSSREPPTARRRTDAGSSSSAGQLGQASVKGVWTIKEGKRAFRRHVLGPRESCQSFVPPRGLMCSWPRPPAGSSRLFGAGPTPALRLPRRLVIFARPDCLAAWLDEEVLGWR